MSMDSKIVKTLDSFFGAFTRIKYKRGEVILRPEDNPQGVLYLKKGYVRQYMVAQNGAMLMLHIFKPGSFFPMTWVMNNEPNRYFLEAVTPVEIWRAPKDDVKKFLNDHPAVIVDLTRRLLWGISGFRHRMEYLVMDSAYQKTVLLFTYLVQNLGEKEGVGFVLPVPVTHREIAAWIGTTRETASLQVEELKKRGLIQYRRRQLIIPNFKKLEKEIEQ